MSEHGHVQDCLHLFPDSSPVHLHKLHTMNPQGGALPSLFKLILINTDCHSVAFGIQTRPPPEQAPGMESSGPGFCRFTNMQSGLYFSLVPCSDSLSYCLKHCYPDLSSLILFQYELNLEAFSTSTFPFPLKSNQRLTDKQKTP